MTLCLSQGTAPRPCILYTVTQYRGVHPVEGLSWLANIFNVSLQLAATVRASPRRPTMGPPPMDADFVTTRSSRPTAGSVAVLLSGTMRGFREGCISSLREHIMQPNAQHGVGIYLATYTESDCGRKIRAMRRFGALTGVSLRDGVSVLPIVSLRASDVNATYLQ